MNKYKMQVENYACRILVANMLALCIETNYFGSYIAVTHFLSKMCCTHLNSSDYEMEDMHISLRSSDALRRTVQTIQSI